MAYHSADGTYQSPGGMSNLHGPLSRRREVVLVAPANGGRFTTFSEARVPAALFDFRFDARAASNILVGFFLEPIESDSNSYEIAIGTRPNRQLSIDETMTGFTANVQYRIECRLRWQH